MARREYPFILTNNLDKFLRIKQAKLSIEQGRAVTLGELYKEMAEYIGATENTIPLIKSNNYNPSLIVALAIAQYLDTSVDNIFSIKRIES